MITYSRIYTHTHTQHKQHTLTPNTHALTQNTPELSTVLCELTPELCHAPCVAHALKVRSAWALQNYHNFFRLYRTTPNVGACLLDMFVERERVAALKAMAKAYVA